MARRLIRSPGALHVLPSYFPDDFGSVRVSSTVAVATRSSQDEALVGAVDAYKISINVKQVGSR